MPSQTLNSLIQRNNTYNQNNNNNKECNISNLQSFKSAIDKYEIQRLPALMPASHIILIYSQGCMHHKSGKRSF